MKKITFSIFSKILLLLLIIFLGLAFYTYNMFQEEKEAIKNKKTIIKVNTPLHHPPLSDKREVDKVNNREENNTEENNESNQTQTQIEGAEYISEIELERRSLEENLWEQNSSEELLNDAQIIPQEEIDNYPLAETLDLAQEEIMPEEVNIEEENILQEVPTPQTMEQSSNPFLGERIDTNPQQPQIHPSLGRPIGNHESSPF